MGAQWNTMQRSQKNQRYFLLKLIKEGRTPEICTSQNVPLGTIDLGSFEVLSDHGDAVEDDVDVNEFSEEATGVMHPRCHLPLGLRRQRLSSIQRCIA